MPFSFHSSLEEIIGFINYVNAKTLTMCVARGGYAGMDEMRKLLRRRGCKLGEINHSSDYASNDSSVGQQKRRKTLTGSSSYKKVMSNTAEDPDEHTPDGSGSGSSWTSRKSGSLPVVSKSKLDSIQEEEAKASSHSSVPSKADTKSQPKSSSQPHSCPAITEPLIDCTNLPKASTQKDAEEKPPSAVDVVETTAIVTEEHTCSLERSLSWEIVAIVPNTPPPPYSPQPQDDVIVISSDDEDTKPFMTRLETRRFFRAFRKCHTKNDEYIAKARAKSNPNPNPNAVI